MMGQENARGAAWAVTSYGRQKRYIPDYIPTSKFEFYILPGLAALLSHTRSEYEPLATTCCWL